MCGLSNLTNVEDSGCTSLRVHLGSLLASGPALALVLHLTVKCGSRTPGLEFRCRIVSREEGYCVSWVPLGVERVACMTAAYLKTLVLICLTKLFLVIALTLCQFESFNDWGGGDVPNLSPFWERTARK